MKVIFAGAGHWHLPLYLDPLRTASPARLVGITDHDPVVAARIGTAEGCAADVDLAGLCARLQPDLLFILGRHVDMAANARVAIAARIPFVIEKPAGMSAGEVAELAAAARAAGVFAAVPLVFRGSGFMDVLRPIVAREPVVYASFKFIAGLPGRYRTNGCDWMLDRRLAGGGVLTNLGVHFIDLLDEIMPGAEREARVCAATFARFADEGDVEDYAEIALRRGRALGRVEVGYLYPAPTGIFDMHFSVRTRNHYVTALGPGRVEVTDLAGNRTRHEVTTTNMEVYPGFVADIVRRVREDAPPAASLDDMARVMTLLEAAYACAKPEGD